MPSHSPDPTGSPRPEAPRPARPLTSIPAQVACRIPETTVRRPHHGRRVKLNMLINHGGIGWRPCTRCGGRASHRAAASSAGSVRMTRIWPTWLWTCAGSARTRCR